MTSLMDVDLLPSLDTLQKLLSLKKMSSLHAGVLLFKILRKGCRFVPKANVAVTLFHKGHMWG